MALTLLTAPILPAAAGSQWTANVEKNTFVNSTSRHSSSSREYAVDHVMVRCGDGCFYAWIDRTTQVVNVEVMDSCGRRALRYGSGGTPGPYQVEGTATASPYDIREIAGAAYSSTDTSQMLLAYTKFDTVAMRNQLWAAVFDWDSARPDTLTVGGPVLVHASALMAPVTITPSVDSNYTAFGVDGTIDGAVVGYREFGVRTGQVNIYLQRVTGPALIPVATTCAAVDAFTIMAAPLPRLVAFSDRTGMIYAAWRRWNGSNWEYRGTLYDPGSCTPVWLQSHSPASTLDDWACASDLQGGAFFAMGDGRSIVAGHVTAAGVFSNIALVSAVRDGQVIQTLAMVGIDAVGATVRAALAFRSVDGSGADATYLDDLTFAVGSGANTGLTIPNRTGLSMGDATEGAAVLGKRGVTVTCNTMNGTHVRVTRVETGTWTARHRGAAVSTAAGAKHVPLVVAKSTVPDVIIGWVDERTVNTGPGAYVQSILEEWLGPQHPFQSRFKPSLYGSNVQCFDVLRITSLPTARPVPFCDGNKADGLGREPYRWDPVEREFILVKDIHPGAGNSLPSSPMAVGSRNVFAATDATNGRELWITDGTTAGTVLLADVNPGAASSNSVPMNVIGGHLIFAAVTLAEGAELWRTDGTTAGTMLVKDIWPGAGSSSPTASAAVARGSLYFAANDGVYGTELWRSDGTEAGTVLVSDLATGSASASPSNFVSIGDRIVFTATEPVLGRELYVYDSATNAVSLLRDIRSGAASSSPALLTRVGGLVFFIALDDATGTELWVTDGTPTGTRLVKDIHTAGSSAPAGLVSAYDRLWFSADDGVHGRELWRSDGTSAGTVMVADIRPGSGSANSALATPIGGGALVFRATSDATGSEVWVTDGTSMGTVLLVDLMPGTQGSSPHLLTVVNGTLFIGATGPHGRVTVAFDLAGAARYSGAGAPTTVGTPALSMSGPAMIGGTFSVIAEDLLPNRPVVFCVSPQLASLPLPMVMLGGQPTSFLYLDPGQMLTLSAVADGAGRATLPLAVPNRPDLAGRDLHWQVFILDPALPYALPLGNSNAMSVTIE